MVVAVYTGPLVAGRMRSTGEKTTKGLLLSLSLSLSAAPLTWLVPNIGVYFGLSALHV